MTSVYAIDSIPERVEQAKALGAIPINLDDNPVQKNGGNGRGADVVLEVVGHADAWNLAFDRTMSLEDAPQAYKSAKSKTIHVILRLSAKSHIARPGLLLIRGAPEAKTSICDISPRSFDRWKKKLQRAATARPEQFISLAVETWLQALAKEVDVE